jgi:uncharacterized RDD family membrane protein YckC
MNPVETKASFLRRLAASILDDIVIWILTVASAFVLIQAAKFFDSALVDSPTLPSWAGMAVILLIILIRFGYDIVLHKKYGQTVGKKLLQIRVVRTDDSELTWKTALIRTLSRILCSLTIGIGYLLIIVDDNKQGLHDTIAGTYVIKVEK